MSEREANYWCYVALEQAEISQSEYYSLGSRFPALFSEAERIRRGEHGQEMAWSLVRAIQWAQEQSNPPNAVAP